VKIQRVTAPAGELQLKSLIEAHVVSHLKDQRSKELVACLWWHHI